MCVKVCVLGRGEVNDWDYSTFFLIKNTFLFLDSSLSLSKSNFCTAFVRVQRYLKTEQFKSILPNHRHIFTSLFQTLADLNIIRTIKKPTLFNNGNHVDTSRPPEMVQWRFWDHSGGLLEEDIFFFQPCVCVCVSVGEIDSGCQSLKCECVCWWAYKWCAVQGRYHTSGTQSQWNISA